MKLAVKVDNDILAEIPNVPGLIKNTIHTISVPVPYATDVEGMHVVRAIIDADNEIAELNELNNEATRSFVVGPAANLYFDSFEASSGPDPSPLPFAGGGFGGLPMTTFSNGSNGGTAIDALIKNNGDLDVVADVKFSFTANITDTIYLGTIQVDIPAGGSQLISHPWEELESSATVMGEIINVSELEFDTSDNFASTELNVFDVDITSINSCENQLGSLTVVASNGVPPYSYNWSNGYVGDVFEGGPGTYSVTVIDAEGTRAVATGTILEDPDCIEEVCSLSAMSFHVPNTCDPETGEYNTTLVVAYENAPAEGYLLVNGMEYEITGSPQSINVPFTSGNLVYEVSFSDNDDCALTVITGTSRDECMQDCEGNYGGNVLPGSSCEFSDGIPGIIDEDCNCIEVCQTPEISVSLVDANSGAIECVEEGGQYYVLVELIGGSSNDTYSLYDSGDALITEFTSGSNYLAGPYNEGDSVSFTAIGNQDDECSVTSETIEATVCGTEPDPCLNPEIFVSLVDANAGAIECVEEGGQYYVLVELTGGSGNDTYSLYDGGDALTTEFTSGSNYLAGPYDEGDSVSFTAIGNQDDECSVTSETIEATVCGTEPDPCLNPEISVSLVDANAGAIECVEEGGQYYVLVELTGGSGNDSYSLFDGGDDALTTEFISGSNYLAGPYDEGDSVSFTAIGNQDDDCSVTSDLVDPVTCDSDPGPDCELPYNPEASNSEVYISHIQLAGIGIDIGNDYYDFIYTSNQMSEGGYGEIEDPVLVVYPGLQSGYTVSSGPAGSTLPYHYSVWVDFNQNGCFEADEQIIFSQAGGVVNGSIGATQVPFTWEIFAPGTYQARIRNSLISHPLATGEGDGEALDFTIEVVSQADAEHLLGVESQEFINFSFHPNPVGELLNLRAGMPIEQVEIYNLLGQKVLQTQPQTLEAVLDMDRLQSGVYLMNVQINGSTKTFKVVKK